MGSSEKKVSIDAPQSEPSPTPKSAKPGALDLAIYVMSGLLFILLAAVFVYCIVNEMWKYVSFTSLVLTIVVFFWIRYYISRTRDELARKLDVIDTHVETLQATAASKNSNEVLAELTAARLSLEQKIGDAKTALSGEIKKLPKSETVIEPGSRSSGTAVDLSEVKAAAARLSDVSTEIQIAAVTLSERLSKPDPNAKQLALIKGSVDAYEKKFEDILTAIKEKSEAEARLAESQLQVDKYWKAYEKAYNDAQALRGDVERHKSEAKDAFGQCVSLREQCSDALEKQKSEFYEQTALLKDEMQRHVNACDDARENLQRRETELQSAFRKHEQLELEKEDALTRVRDAKAALELVKQYSGRCWPDGVTEELVPSRAELERRAISGNADAMLLLAQIHAFAEAQRIDNVDFKYLSTQLFELSRWLLRVLAAESGADAMNEGVRWQKALNAVSRGRYTIQLPEIGRPYDRGWMEPPQGDGKVSRVVTWCVKDSKNAVAFRAKVD